MFNLLKIFNRYLKGTDINELSKEDRKKMLDEAIEVVESGNNKLGIMFDEKYLKSKNNPYLKSAVSEVSNQAQEIMLNHLNKLKENEN